MSLCPPLTVVTYHLIPQPESLAVCLERRAAALAAMTAAGAAGVVVPAAPAQPNTTDPSGT